MVGVAVRQKKFAGAPDQASESNVLRQRCDARGFKSLPIEIIARRKVAPAFEPQRDRRAGSPNAKRGHDTGQERGPTPALGHGMVGGLRFTRKICRGPHIKRQKAMCCDSVAMRAVSSDQQLKLLRDERWREPLSSEASVVGPPKLPATIGKKGSRDRAPGRACNLLFGDLVDQT
jgi:hypothetical protein